MHFQHRCSLPVRTHDDGRAHVAVQRHQRRAAFPCETDRVDASNSELVVGHTDSDAESIARRLPSSHVVASLQATPSELLLDVFEARASSPRPNIVYCGDHAPSKERAAALLGQIGFDPVDAGPLRIARPAEPFGKLATALAYGHEEGPKWVYHFSRLK